MMGSLAITRSSKVKKWTYEGSDWTINSMIQQQFVISEIAPCE